MCWMFTVFHSICYIQKLRKNMNPNDDIYNEDNKICPHCRRTLSLTARGTPPEKCLRGWVQDPSVKTTASTRSQSQMILWRLLNTFIDLFHSQLKYLLVTRSLMSLPIWSLPTLTRATSGRRALRRLSSDSAIVCRQWEESLGVHVSLPTLRE